MTVALQLQVLESVSIRLANPRAWLQGCGYGHRDDRGVVLPFAVGATRLSANCWCVSVALWDALKATGLSFDEQTRLYEPIAVAILATVTERTGRVYGNIPHWNDDRKHTSHREVREVLHGAAIRLRNAP